MSDHRAPKGPSCHSSFVMPSGPDGDFLENDILQVCKGKSVVSLWLIPNKGILRVFPKEDKDFFIQFQKSDEESFVTFSCLHELGSLSSNTNKQQKICCSTKIKIDFDTKRKMVGGGANITTLRAHGQLHFPKSCDGAPSIAAIRPEKAAMFLSEKKY
jgi:hypothetical protein